MELTSLIDQYGELKKKSNKLYSEYKGMQEELQHLSFALQSKMQEIGLKSAKSANFGVSTATRTNIFVQSEQSVINWLKDTPNIEYDAYIGLKTKDFKSMAQGWLKETGEVIPGTDVQQVESITIKANKK